MVYKSHDNKGACGGCGTTWPISRRPIWGYIYTRPKIQYMSDYIISDTSVCVSVNTLGGF